MFEGVAQGAALGVKDVLGVTGFGAAVGEVVRKPGVIPASIDLVSSSSWMHASRLSVLGTSTCAGWCGFKLEQLALTVTLSMVANAVAFTSLPASPVMLATC